MLRAAFWFFLTTLALGLALCVAIIVHVYTDPHPGARMYLMGIQCLAVPMAGCATMVFVLASTDTRKKLKWWERQIGWHAGSLTLAVFGALFILG